MPSHVDLNTVGTPATEQQQDTASTRPVPEELRNARPASGNGSPWKTAGRVLLGILSAGLSELLPLALRGIKYVASKIMKADAREPRIKKIPANALPPAPPEGDSFNQDVAFRLLSGMPLPSGLEDSAQGALSTLRKKYGSDLVPEGQKLKTLLGSGTQTVRQKILGQPGMVTPEQIKEWVLLEGKTCAITKALGNKLKECWPKNLGKMSVLIPGYALARCPELKKDLEACENAEEISKVLAQHDAEIQSFIQLKKQLDDTSRQARIQFASTLCKGLGLQNLPVSDFQVKSFDKKLGKLAEKILSGEYPGCLEEGFDPAEAFRTFAQEQAGIRVQEYESIKDLPDLSDDLKNAFKHMVITKDTVTQGELINYVNLGSKVDASPLMALLEEPTPRIEDIQEEMLRLGEKLDSAIQAQYGAENWVNVEPDDRDAIQAYASQVMLDKVPGLRKAFSELPQLSGLSEWCHEQMFNDGHPQYGDRMPNVAGIARLMVNSTGEIGIRVNELRSMQGISPII